MKESLVTRVRRIVSGNAHLLLDAVENAAPEAVMEQAIRDVDGALDDVRAELGLVLANQHVVRSRLQEERTKLDELANNVEFAVREGRDDLAEAAIGQQLDHEAQIPILEKTVAEAEKEADELKGYVTALQAKKREMREALMQFEKSRPDRAAVAGGLSGTPETRQMNAEANVDGATDAFDRVLQRATGAAGGPGVPDAQTASQLLELEDMARQNRVQERLAAVKAKVDAG